MVKNKQQDERRSLTYVFSNLHANKIVNTLRGCHALFACTAQNAQ